MTFRNCPPTLLEQLLQDTMRVEAAERERRKTLEQLRHAKATTVGRLQAAGCPTTDMAHHLAQGLGAEPTPQFRKKLGAGLRQEKRRYGSPSSAIEAGTPGTGVVMAGGAGAADVVGHRATPAIAHGIGDAAPAGAGGTPILVRRVTTTVTEESARTWVRSPGTSFKK